MHLAYYNMCEFCTMIPISLFITKIQNLKWGCKTSWRILYMMSNKPLPSPTCHDTALWKQFTFRLFNTRVFVRKSSFFASTTMKRRAI
jgi:hypothetical protein